MSVLIRLIFFKSLLKSNSLKLLVENLRRLDETKQDDYEAIFAILTIFDHYSQIDEDYCFDVVKKSDLFTQLFYRMRTQEKLDENKAFCAEILSVYVQTGGNCFFC